MTTEQEIRRNPTMNERFLLDLLNEVQAKVERVREWRNESLSSGWIEEPVEGLDAALSDDPKAFWDALDESED